MLSGSSRTSAGRLCAFGLQITSKVEKRDTPRCTISADEAHVPCDCTSQMPKEYIWTSLVATRVVNLHSFYPSTTLSVPKLSSDAISQGAADSSLLPASNVANMHVASDPSNSVVQSGPNSGYPVQSTSEAKWSVTARCIAIASISTHPSKQGIHDW